MNQLVRDTRIVVADQSLGCVDGLHLRVGKQDVVGVVAEINGIVMLKFSSQLNAVLPWAFCLPVPAHNFEIFAVFKLAAHNVNDSKFETSQQLLIDHYLPVIRPAAKLMEAQISLLLR